MIVDLKIRQYRTKYLNEDLEQNITRLKKIEEVIKRQKHDNDDESHLSISKLALLLGDIKQLVMEVVLHNFNEDDEKILEDKYYADAMERTYKIYSTILAKSETRNIEYDILTETHMKFGLFADNVLFSPSQVTENAIETKGIEKGMLARILVKSGFEALARGASNSSMLIPRMLEALTLYPDHCGKDFKKESAKIPSWKFLNWKSQIIACINQPISDYISVAVKNLFKSYPQAMFYVFKVVESDVTLKMSKVRESKLFKALTTYIEQNNKNLNAFAESLDCLVDPELRWKYWFDLIREAMLREDFSSREQASRFASLMMENIAYSERKYVDK